MDSAQKNDADTYSEVQISVLDSYSVCLHDSRQDKNSAPEK